MENVDFILLTGDLADSGLKTEFEWVCDIMEKSDKPILPPSATTTVSPLVKNLGKSIWPYRLQFHLPKQQIYWLQRQSI